MGKSNGGGFWKFFLIVMLLVIVLVGVFFIWKALAADGWFTSPEELRDQLANLSAENELLQDALDETTAENVALGAATRGIPSFAFWGLIFAAGIFSTAFLSVQGSIGGKNINQEQAERIATRIMEKAENGEWKYFRENPGHYPVWRRRKPYTGQAVEGDLDSLWYVIEFAQDFPVGGGQAPSHMCACVLLKSNDADRQRIIEHGMTARDAARAHGIKLQRSASPSQLAEELRQLDILAGVSENIEKISGGE